MARKKRSSVQQIRGKFEPSVQAINEEIHSRPALSEAQSGWDRFLVSVRALLTVGIANAVLIGRRIQKKRKSRLLMVKESVPLGDKRFVALVAVGDEQFLIGGAANSVSLLSRLERSEQREALEFRDLLQRIQPKGVVC